MPKGKERADSVRSDNPFIYQPGPPANETHEERSRRVKAQQDAQIVSRRIDENLQQSKKLLERRKHAVKILLLGQAESGKSAVVKNFQMAFTPSKFSNERALWKRIVQLNLISSLKVLFSALQEQQRVTPSSQPTFMDKTHLRLYLSLSPVISIETNLNKVLREETLPLECADVCVRAGSDWRSKLSGKKPSAATAKNDPTSILEACKDDILALWSDPHVREVLNERGVHLEQSPGFFLDDVSRITSRGYEPTDEDIVRARVRTIGIEEHHFVTEPETGTKPSEFFIIDVGGHRGARSSWVPYFDDVQAIIFLAPLMFHQVLAEDSRINRLEDTIMLWRQICSNRLLADAQIILFFNKMDILSEMLDAGVMVKTFVPSYGENPNELRAVVKYFRDRFEGYHKRLSPKPRNLLIYETSAINTDTMAEILLLVHDAVVREHLKRLDLL